MPVDDLIIEMPLWGDPEPRRRVHEIADLTPWLTENTISRFRSKVFTGGGPDQCWYFLGAISDTGHGKFQVGSRTDGAIIASAHRVAYHLAYGPLAPGEQVRHQCDESSCQNPAHLLAGVAADNTADWVERRHLPGNPLRDRRGAAGRAVAIRDAIIEAGTHGVLERWGAAMRAAQAGMPAFTHVITGQLDLWNA